MQKLNSPISIDYMPLSQLPRAPRNPKAHDLGLIDRSLARFGMWSRSPSMRLPAGLWPDTAAWTLLKKESFGEEPPGRIVIEDGEWYVPVLRGISFDSDAEAEAYLLASNQTTIAGGWQDDELAKVLAELALQDGGLEGVGFAQDDISELLRRIGADSGPVIEDDPNRLLARALELQRQWQTAEHQFWRAGSHWLCCGNCETVPPRFFGGHKNSLVMGRADYHYRHELILYGWMENGPHRWTGGRVRDSVFEIDRPTNSDQHPTQKPVELITRMIRNSSLPGDIVYDPFAGSGTTLVAGHQLKRTVYAVEKDPLYVAVQLQRLADLGLKPELVERSVTA
jgi:hypothetical protein